MGKMGKFSISGLENLQKQLDRIQERDVDAFVESCAKELAARLLAKVIDETPVGVVPKDIYDNRKKKKETIGKDGKKHKAPSREADIYEKYWAGYSGGNLRRSWSIGEIQKEGDIYRIEVINPVTYASYVEYGHRQQPGRFVPALGKQLKKGWVEGKFMMTISEREIQKIAPRVLEARIKKFLEECMG